MGFFKFEYQTEQDAANEYQREKQQWGDAPIRVVETAQYRILIAPRSHETRFLDFETGDRCSYSEGLILQYQNFVVRIGEDTWCKKMMLPDFIQKNRLFDKDCVWKRQLKAETHPENHPTAEMMGQSQILCKQRRVVENRANIFSAAAAQAVAALSTT